mgnify:CR=1 FL=1
MINRDAVGGNDHDGGTQPKEAVEIVTPLDGNFTIYGLDQGGVLPFGGRSTGWIPEIIGPDRIDGKTDLYER